MATDLDRMDIVDVFRKSKKYLDPASIPAGSVVGGAPPRGRWEIEFGNWLLELDRRPSMTWPGSWPGVPVEKFNALVRKLTEGGFIRITRHQTPGHADTWTVGKGENWKDFRAFFEKEVAGG